MYKYLITVFAVAVLSQSAHAQTPLSKEEKKRIKSELKAYMKDPDIYKQTMDRYTEIIDSSKKALAAKDAGLRKLSAENDDLKKQKADLQAAIVSCENKPAPHCPECACSGAIPATGVYYKVQIGSVKKYNEKAFAEAKGLVVEKGGETNHYVFSYFDSKDDATAFAAELKKLGVQSTTVVRYENGVRAKATEKKPVLQISEGGTAPAKTKAKPTKKPVKKKK